MALELPLDSMTTSEKLEALEAIWAHLSRSPSEISSPAWHGELLKAREEEVVGDGNQFTDWSEAKQAIRDQVK